MADKILKTLDFGTGDIYLLHPDWVNVDGRPTKLSEFTNDLEIDSSTAVDQKISEHNASTTAHSDIRDLITGLDTRLTALADCDDETLDQLSEIVAYIKSNKELIDSVTTSKIGVDAIVANLESTDDTKVLAASQGKVLKDLIDVLQQEIDTDEAALSTHTADTVAHVTADERAAWNAKASTDVATQEANGLMAAADKTKLDGIAEGANNYVHPETHAATMIVEDETHRFVTDEEKAAWDAKSSVSKITATDDGAGNVVLSLA